MKEIDIIQQIKSGEVSKVQFKERLLDNYDIGCELVAFSNARGGKLIVGVKDKTGSINRMSVVFPLPDAPLPILYKLLSRAFGVCLIPDYYPCPDPRLVSCYALFE